TERALRVPRPPRGCAHAQPVLDRRLFVNRVMSISARRPCRSAGIYELHGRRLIARVTGRVHAYDIAGRRIASVRPKPSNGLWVRVGARRLGDTSGGVIVEDGGAAVGYGVQLIPQWSGNRLWIGQSSYGIGGLSGSVTAYDGPRLARCLYATIA